MEAPGLRLGGTRVDLLLDGVFEAGRDVLTHRGGFAARARTFDLWGDGPLRLDVNCFLLRGPRGIELVDAGTGPSWGANLGHARQALRDHGVVPEDVARVFLTHLHGDHALGLLEDDDAFFPRADVIVPAADLAFHTDGAERDRLPAPRRAAFAIASRLIAAYGDRLRPRAFGPVMPGVTLLPLPGHTPGQGGYLLVEGDAALLLLGDAIHLDVMQAADPDVGLIYDLDPAVAAHTRRAILARAAAEGWIVAGGHLRGFGRVAVEGGGFCIAPA